jgi:hypothetical protein
MHQKLDLPKGWHSAAAGLRDEKSTVHSAWATAQLDELPATRDGTLKIQDTESKSWDVASGSGNTNSKTMGAGLASVYGSKMGL